MSIIELEKQIARAQLRIEQLRIYIAELHPSQRAHEAPLLDSTIVELNELMQQRDLQLDRQRALNTAAAA
jgi:hypothetical protein